MNREIKFRAWNIVEGRWATVSEIEEIIIINAFYNGGNFQLDERAGNGLANDLGTKVALMQYTGLKDRNGKEIYEGDILKYGGADQYGPVTYEECAFVVNLILVSELLMNYPFVEVIGNIYEGEKTE